MNIQEWKESMMETNEGTVEIACVMQNVPHNANTSRYNVYDKECTYSKIYDVTTDADGNVISVD